MQSIIENAFWASFKCSNSLNYIKITDETVIDRLKTGAAEIIDTGNGAIVIVNDVVLHRCDVVDRMAAQGQLPAFGGAREQQLAYPWCLYPSADRHYTLYR